MALKLRVQRPLTHKGKKALIDKEPKLIENTKQSLFLRGRKCNETLLSCLKDLYQLKKPDAVMMNGKNDFVPLDNATPLETLSKKSDSSLFFFGSHSKKRPNNLVIGRMYDHQVLDIVELGVDEYKGLKDFDTEKISVGLKPCLVFSGPKFSQDENLMRIKNLFVDMFHRENVQSVRLQGLEHVLTFTESENKIFMRSYRVLLKKSGTRLPRVELEEIGPSIDFSLRRMKLASEDLFKLACKKPKELKVKKVKNISRDPFGSKLGRVHIKQQNINKLQTRKLKALKKRREEKKNKG
ncbi:ribosome production factor 2 homolog [Cimex lectularius]|uniref:Ribosome production factor 2 homolog n=1 Tax=Cimex lectularius TaxID=79782 RepID=A0A8I6SGB9_CIMLE|nr:ribosome production factor 2 homolog [Cimex lectularius]